MAAFVALFFELMTQIRDFQQADTVRSPRVNFWKLKVFVLEFSKISKSL